MVTTTKQINSFLSVIIIGSFVDVIYSSADILVQVNCINNNRAKHAAILLVWAQQVRQTQGQNMRDCILSYDQDTLHVEQGCAEMYDFCMAALMFLTGHWTRCIITTWKALSLQPRASEALVMHLAGKCVISARHGFLL